MNVPDFEASRLLTARLLLYSRRVPAILEPPRHADSGQCIEHSGTVSARLGGFTLVRNRMCQRGFGNLAGIGSLLGYPVAEGRTEENCMDAQDAKMAAFLRPFGISAML